MLRRDSRRTAGREHVCVALSLSLSLNGAAAWKETRMRKTLDLANLNKERTAREQIEADSWYPFQPAPKIRKFKLETRYPHKRSEGLTHRNASQLNNLTKGNRRVFISPARQERIVDARYQ